MGVPDERYGEVVGAFVVPKDQGKGAITIDEIKQWVRERLSNHLGESIEILFSIFPSWDIFMQETARSPRGDLLM